MSIDTLSHRALEGAKRPLAQAETLPPAAYTSEAIHRLETERILEKEWICVGRLDQVPEPGDFLPVDRLGRKLLLTRDTDGRVRLVSRVCRHRHAELVSARGNGRSLQCPYHRWTYRLDGSLVGAPMMEGVEFDKTRCRLPEVRTETWLGFVFACLDEGAAPLAPRLPGLASRLETYRAHDLQVAGTLTFDHHFNWKILVENFMESYHHIGTHSDSLEPLFPARMSSVEDNQGAPWSLLKMPAQDDRDVPGSSALPGIPGVEGSAAGLLLAASVYPFHLMAFTASQMTWYEIVPKAVDRLELRIHLCLPREIATRDDYEPARKEQLELLRRVHEEDIAACESVWEGVQAEGEAPGRLQPLEAAIWQQNQWWMERMCR